MNVTSPAATVQAFLQPKFELQRCVLGPLALSFCLGLLPTGAADAESIVNLEAVDNNGMSTWSGNYPTSITGVLLTDPDEMLDARANFVPWNDGAGAFQLGGQWQVFVQATAPGDRGGVECWMGQNYGNLPWLHSSDLSYSDDDWTGEVRRVSHDPASGHPFRKGDLVTVTASASLFYGGMQNINEEHSIDPANNFSIMVVSTNSSLPEPEVISLSSVVRPDDGFDLTHEDLFDSTRSTGGEHWQGMRVRINGLTLISTNGWNPALDWDSRKCTVSDGEGRKFTLVHPRSSLGPPPAAQFDATGVFLQESGSGADGTYGYELFAQEIAPSDTPSLKVEIRAGLASVSWPGSLRNYQLERAGSLAPAQWGTVTNTPAVVDGANSLKFEVGTSMNFFRLRRTK